MIVALTGFMASGKSTFGRAAAEVLGVDFIDLDTEITSRYGTVDEIFSQGGEALFRKLESETLINTINKNGNTVLSLGGGTVMNESNRLWLKENAVTIWLDTSWDIVLSELGNSDRPIIKNKSTDQIRQMYQSRRPVYRSVADMVIVIENCDWEAVISDLAEAIRTTLSL